MINEAFSTGATIEEAQEAAIKALAAPKDADVKTEIISLPTKKMLGLFGGSPAKVRAWYEYEENPYAAAEVYLKKILAGFGIDDCKIEFIPAEENVLKVNITCEQDYGIVIGRRGETLDAIQYLLRLFVNKIGKGYSRISLNVGDYREKREVTLKSVAEKTAQKVKKYGRREVLEPMNPYERRIIHTTIQGIDGVTSRSVGVDTGRRVIVELEKGFKPLKQGRSGGGYKGNNKSSYNNESSQQKAHSSDAQGASLYGKIEPKTKTEE